MIIIFSFDYKHISPHPSLTQTQHSPLTKSQLTSQIRRTAHHRAPGITQQDSQSRDIKIHSPIENGTSAPETTSCTQGIAEQKPPRSKMASTRLRDIRHNSHKASAFALDAIFSPPETLFSTCSIHIYISAFRS